MDEEEAVIEEAIGEAEVGEVADEVGEGNSDSRTFERTRLPVVVVHTRQTNDNAMENVKAQFYAQGHEMR